MFLAIKREKEIEIKREEIGIERNRDGEKK